MAQLKTDPAIPPEVAQHLGYYVYLYVDPRSGKPFYVGKGKGRRLLAHLSARGESHKTVVLEELRAAGLQPRLDILAHALADEETALRIEAAVIDLLGLDDLTNLVRGWRSIQLGRMTLEELTPYYAAEPSTIEDPVLLIRINQRYRHGMSARELYEATRGIWKLSPSHAEQASYAFAVFEGIVREVYVIDKWHPAGTLKYETRDLDLNSERSKRWEFEGRVAHDRVRTNYLGSSVSSYFPRGSQSPVRYVNC
jgi:uncharacterized protein